MAEQRQYTEADKATALALLAANGGNVFRAAKELGIPESTLRKWKNGEGVNAAVAGTCEKKKAELFDLFEEVSRLYLGRAKSREAVNKTSGRDAVIAAATALDKMRLIQNKPTTISRSELPIDLSKLNAEQLAQLDAILAAAGLPPADRA